MSRTLLIDADIIAYQCSASNERTIDWGDGVVSHTADLKAAKRAARDTIDHLMAKLDGSDLIVCLSDDFDNHRHDIYPDYKGHRSKERPTHLYDIKEWLGQRYPTRLNPRLEADDTIGILATEPHQGDRIIVSMDKDLQTIPGLLYRPHEDQKGVVEISRQRADRFLLWQTICGDQTDGYPGCPGAGPAAAEMLLAGQGYEGYDHEFRRGPRKGQTERRWRIVPMDRWPAIVSAYEKAGQGEKEALIQANLARILRHGDWDGRRVRRWSPADLAEAD